jgi:hypothetical protein
MDKALYFYGKTNSKGIIATVFLLSCAVIIILVLEHQKSIATGLNSLADIGIGIICSIAIFKLVSGMGNASGIDRKIMIAIFINFIIIAVAGILLSITM